MADYYEERAARVQERMAADGLDGLAIAFGSDIKYLTGFTGEYGIATVLVTPRERVLVTDGRFETQAAAETSGYAIRISRDYLGELGRAAAELGVTRLGVRSDTVTHAGYRALEAACPGVELAEAPDYIGDLRAIKTPEELELIERACRISERSFYAVLDKIRPGATEVDVANALEYEFRSRGGEGFCFETIVASGPDNGACPHATAGKRALEDGDFVTIDFGTYFEGYCSDITRTVLIGRAKRPELYDVFKIVAEAKQAGEEALRPGLSYRELWHIINGVVEDAGYTIPHGPGHNFGLDIHEAPFITKTNGTLEAPGMVHTIEPGIYLPGVGGIRQEDDYLVTEDGARRLTHITDDLIVL